MTAIANIETRDVQRAAEVAAMSAPAWIADIPSPLLYEKNTRDLRRWLHDRGRRLSLLDLGAERRRRRTITRRNA